MILNIEDNNALSLSVSDQDDLTLSAGDVISTGGDPFEGPYEYIPSEDAQTIPISGFQATQDITIDAVPGDYVGSEVPRRASTDLTASGDTVSAPAGYYEEAVSKPVAHGSAKSPEGTVTVNPIVTVDNEGVITATVNKDLTLTPTVVPGYVDHGTSGVLTAKGNTQYQMYKRTSDDLTQSGGTITAPLGYYPQNASKTVSLKPTVLRPDAQLVQTYTFDKMAVEDLELTIPAYTTTAQSLRATANLSPTITIDLATETFFVIERFLTIPEYSITTVGKGRQEYTYCTYIYELARVPADAFKSRDGSKTITSASNIIGTMSSYREIYWSSATALSAYGTNAYGCYQTPTAPAISGSTLTIKTPVLGIRGSTSYFTSTYMNAVTDIRYQYVIDVYKAPKQAMGIDGWITNEVVNHIIDCANSTTHKLT